MNKIEKLIEEFCPQGVAFRTLGEVLQRTKGTPITAKQMNEINKTGAPIKIFAGGKTVAYVDYGDIPKKDVLTTESVIVKSRGIIGFEYINKPFSHKNEFWSYHSNNPEISIKYIFYYLKNKEYYFQSVGKRMSKMPQLSIPDTDKFKIPIPPLTIQKEIVKILDNFTRLEAELEAELTARKKQYEHYREALLNFGDDVEFRALGEVCGYSKNRVDASGLNAQTFIGVDNLLPNKAGKNDASYSPNTKRLTSYRIGDVLLGNIRPYLKKIWLADNEGGCSGDVLAIHISGDNHKSLIPEFIYYLLSSDIFFAYDMQHAKGAKMPRGSKEAILNYQIPIPHYPNKKKSSPSSINSMRWSTTFQQGCPQRSPLAKNSMNITATSF